MSLEPMEEWEKPVAHFERMHVHPEVLFWQGDANA
ncbi:hypothetical protein C4K04_3770 [Pseudomonas chlororaphis]|uniref:Uncharacterized protein n=1 Tax=Pseudomonas chlororaphis TaxID=587753 RepID=A0A3G7TQU2_9PSED|nr:hypothetical protein C4K04_3770 [Pseudomonas chlororaphis]